MPLELSRLSQEDLVNLDQFNKAGGGSTDDGTNSNSGTYDFPDRAESVSGLPMVEMTDQLEENIRHRGKAYMSVKNSLLSKDDDDSDEPFTSSKGERSKSLFQRSSELDTANLEEF